MKKIVIIICILFGTFMSFAQERSYRISVNGNAHQRKNSRCAEYIIEAILTDNSRKTIAQGSYGTDVFGINDSITISNDFPVKQIRFWAKRHHNKRCKKKSKHEGQTILLVPYPHDCFFSTSIEHTTGLFGAGLWYADLIVKIEPLVEVLSPVISDFLPLDHKIDLRATPGFSEVLSTYTWQYSVGNTVSFQDVPAAFNGTSTIQASARDILGSTAQSYLGKEIQFRISSCNDRRYSISPRTYTIVPSAPTFFAKSELFTSCYDSGDGSVRFTFSRELFPGERLSILPVVGSSLFPSTPELSVLQINPDTGKRDSYTIENLPPGNYEATVLGFYDRFNTYTEDSAHFMKFTIGRPEVVEIVSVVGTNSRCNDGDGDPDTNNDGEILITTKGGNLGVFQYAYRTVGGTFSAWADFNTGTQHRMTNEKPGDYEIKVKKVLSGRVGECIAYELNSSNEPTSVVKIVPVTITEPDAPLQIAYTLLNEPRAFGFKDGRINARIFGGSKFGDGSYRFEWKNEAGQILNTIATEVLSGTQGYAVTLHSIGVGKYYLNVWDAKYDEATYQMGCFQINSEYELQQPDLLEVRIEILNDISCHIENEYSDGIDFNDPLGIPDQFQDGALVAYVKGGVPFANTNANLGECRANFMPYCYRWKKNVGGVWQNIAVNDSIIENQSVGTYALNVEDKNGIVLGTYEAYTDVDGSMEYRLVQAMDSTKYVPQPDKLGISFTSTVVTCLNGDDAQASALVTGGTKPYAYEWSTGKMTSSITNLIAGTYIIFVTDAKGCQIEGSIKIGQPNGLEIFPTVVIPPTCFKGNDGKIEVGITGGNPPYRYVWNTGSTTTAIDGLSSGTYRIEVTDNKGCKAFYEVQLKDPDPIIVAIEKKRSLCGDQSLTLDIAIDDPGAVYSWSSENGFTSSESTVEITKAGRYVATITSSLGCIGIGEIAIEVFDTPIDAHFLIATQAYTDQEVILINISDPIGETVAWTVPGGVEIISESKEELVLNIEKEGPYDINLRSYQKDCYQDYTKTILVEPAIETPEVFSSSREFIEEFIVYPNPNGGVFKTKITLAEDANIVVKIISLMSGTTIYERSEKNNRDFLLEYQVAIPTGLYLMLLETPKGSAVRKVVFE